VLLGDLAIALHIALGLPGVMTVFMTSEAVQTVQEAYYVGTRTREKRRKKSTFWGRKRGRRFHRRRTFRRRAAKPNGHAPASSAPGPLVGKAIEAALPLHFLRGCSANSSGGRAAGHLRPLPRSAPADISLLTTAPLFRGCALAAQRHRRMFHQEVSRVLISLGMS